jgi:putative tricarboxylic transport membrane protein
MGCKWLKEILNNIGFLKCGQTGPREGGDGMRTQRAFIAILAIAASMIALNGFTAAQAQDWPTKPITFIVPFSAGGSADTMARGLATYLGKALNVTIKVVNNDGYTIFVGTQPYISNSIILQGAKYKLEDLDYINIEQNDPCTVAVHADSPYKKLRELIDAIKANPGKLSMGTIIYGSPYLAYMIAADRLKLNARVVTYEGGGPYRTALLGKHVDFVFGTAAGDLAMKPNARVLAVFDDKPFQGWPEAELANEALKPYGVTMPNLASVRFVAVHSTFKAKYPDRYKKLVETYKKVYHSQEYQEFLHKTGAAEVSRWMGPEQTTAYMKEFHELTLKYKDQLQPPQK